jgi:hypothetical protein
MSDCKKSEVYQNYLLPTGPPSLFHSLSVRFNLQCNFYPFNYFKLIIQKIVSKLKILLHKIFYNQKKQLNINNIFLLFSEVVREFQ